MVKRNRLVIIGIIIAIIVIIGVVIGVFNANKVNDIHELITYDRFTTLLNDGGTHTNTRYEINFSKKKVTKLEDYYIGFKGYEYQNKELYTKDLTKEEIAQLKEIFKKITENKDNYSIDNEKTYIYYTYVYEGQEINVYEKVIIDSLEEILKND